jgi:uncharacterized membrane protein YdjX (TVP38/TMEM64 family)
MGLWKKIEKNKNAIIGVIIISIIGGYFTTIYSINLLDQKIIDDAIKQAGSKEVVIIVSILQIALYAVILGAIGLVLSNKMGLWKKTGIISKSRIDKISNRFLSRYIFGTYGN